MIITQTPFRISFFGGGTDYPAYYQEHGGAVLATTINRYCYISLRHLPPFFKYRYRLVYSKMETTNQIDEIIHPSVRECLRFMQPTDGLEIHHDGDLPARSGLGSSSSFTVGLLHALHSFTGKLISKQSLAEEAIHVEQDMIRENVGSQDQTLAAFGGLNVVRFNSYPRHDVTVEPVCLTEHKTKNLEKHLMLFFTGISRIASDIAGEQIRCTPQKTAELSEMHQMVDEAAKVLANDSNLDDFGRMLNESWKIKRSLTSKISNFKIDDLYQRAMGAGALGGKLLGAGGGGFILFFVRPENQERVKEALGLMHVPFQLEFLGSRLIHYEPFYPK